MPKKQWIDFAAVRAALSFADVLTHYNLPAPAGATQCKINCPFHEDASPSCSINLEKGIFKCFGCEAKGNALEFVVLKEGGDKNNPADMHQAAALAVSIMGRDVSEFSKGSAPKPVSAPSVNAKAATAETLDEDAPSPEKPPQRLTGGKKDQTANPALKINLDLEPDHPFLLDRGISAELAETFGIGLCNGGIMKGRIAIPIHNLAGEIVAYAGRYADEEIPAKVERYRFPKRFRKSLELWNIHRAAAFEKRHLTLVEGYWSAIRLHEAGIPAAALMGTSVSDEQAELVRTAGFKFVTLLLDGDDAGREAAKVAAHVLSKQVYVRTLELPDGDKPDTMSASFMKRLT